MILILILADGDYWEKLCLEKLGPIQQLPSGACVLALNCDGNPILILSNDSSYDHVMELVSIANQWLLVSPTNWSQ